MSTRGFSLAEAMVALLLTGIISGSVYRLLTSSQRLYRQQAQRIELNDNVRSAVVLLLGELRGLSATDPLGSDIVAMSESTITYKAMRNLYTTCAVHAIGNVVSLDTTVIGLRGLDAEVDSLLIFADSTSATLRDDKWLHRNVASLGRANNCPGGQPSIDVGILPGLAAADSVLLGSPARGFEVVEVRRYRDASGGVGLGARRYHKRTGWTGLQPVAGPLVATGFRLSYFDAGGHATSDAAHVARIGIIVIGRTATVDYLVDTLATQVALRNYR